MITVGVVVPTLPGRERVLDIALAALEATVPDGYELDVTIPEGYPTVGEAWNAGREDVAGDYLYFTSDDAEMHPGWLETAVETVDAGYIPAARQVHPDGKVEGCGSMGMGHFLPECRDWTPCRSTGLPFVKAEWWDLVGRFLPIHYSVDDDWTWRALLHGIPCAHRTGFAFTHHSERVASQGVRQNARDHLKAYVEHASTLHFPSQTLSPAPMTEIISRNGMTAHQLAAYAMVQEAWQKPDEFEGLLGLLLKDPPGVLIEVGAGRGGSFWAFAQCAARGATLISVDQGEVDGAYCASVDTLRSYAHPEQNVVAVRGDSQLAKTASGVTIALEGRQADFLFLDADHRAEAVRRDYRLYAPLVKPGGLIGLHDIIPVEVNRWTPEYAVEVAPLWDEIKASGVKTWEFIQEDDLTWGGIGVYQVPVEENPHE